MQSLISLTLFKAEQTSVVVKAQTLPIFIKIAQNKGNHKSVSNRYSQLIYSKTHFWLRMCYLFDKTLKFNQNLKLKKRRSDFGWICTTVPGLNLIPGVDAPHVYVRAWADWRSGHNSRWKQSNAWRPSSATSCTHSLSQELQTHAFCNIR